MQHLTCFSTGRRLSASNLQLGARRRDEGFEAASFVFWDSGTVRVAPHPRIPGDVESPLGRSATAAGGQLAALSQQQRYRPRRPARGAFALGGGRKMTSIDMTTQSLRSRNSKGPKATRKETKGGGIGVDRFFTRSGVDVYDTCEWETRSAVITNERGDVVFEQTGVEMPKFWSQMATNVVVSKYFRGHIGTPERESSVRQLIGRVVRSITAWGREGGYFATEADGDAFRDELAHILLYQMASFNSPGWFNVGLEEKPQCSACFINSVKDTMDSILSLARTEGMLFKFGSGTGSNLSSIRSPREPLAGGGTASGPVSFMRGYASFAGVIKSGGKTRRAAKMVILNIDHPDVVDGDRKSTRLNSSHLALSRSCS